MIAGAPAGDVYACDACLRRTALLARVAAHVERARHERRRLGELLALSDEDLLAAVGGRARSALVAQGRAFDVVSAHRRAAAAGLTLICRHAAAYPTRLTDLVDAPALLHVAGDARRLLALDADPAAPAVAVVGARRAGADGLEVARAIARGLAAAGVTVVSGMALGVDSAAHAGALDVGGPTITVLAGGADIAYPRSKQRLYARIVETGCAVSEMPPGFEPFKWCFPARNRVIAALADLTIVVEAAERSGSLITAELAQELGRAVGAVPGPVTSSRTTGTNALLRDGALVVRHAQDALDEVLGVGVARAPGAGPAVEVLEPELCLLLQRVQEGDDTLDRLARTPDEASAAMAGLGELELRGLVRRGVGGRYLRLL